MRFVGVIRFTNFSAGRELEFFLLAKTGTNHVALLLHHRQKKSYLFIDRFRGSELFEARAMVAQNGGFINIDQQFISKMPGHVTDSVFGKRHAAEAQPVVIQVFGRNIP